MELFHIHTLGTYDDMYVPNKVIDIDDTYDNGVYHGIFNLDMTLTSRNLPNLFASISRDLQAMDVKKTVEKSRVDELMQYIQFFGCDQQELIKFIELSAKMVKGYYKAMNEVAYEQSRQKYCPTAPSRLHSMFACEEKALGYWDSILKSRRADIYKIEVSEEPLLTNPSFLPADDAELYNKVRDARRYFTPAEVTDSNSNEYLITGKVLIKEKVNEIRRR